MDISTKRFLILMLGGGLMVAWRAYLRFFKWGGWACAGLFLLLAVMIELL
jgi:hypothetical protein